MTTSVICGCISGLLNIQAYLNRITGKGSFMREDLAKRMAKRFMLLKFIHLYYPPSESTFDGTKVHCTASAHTM